MINNSIAKLSCALALALPALGVAQGKLDWVKPNFENGSQAIHFHGTGLGEPKMSSSQGGKVWKFVFDGSLAGRASEKRIRQNGLRTLLYGWLDNKPPKVYAMAYFDEPCMPKAVKCDDGWDVTWGAAATTAADANTTSTEANFTMPALNPPAKGPTPDVKTETETSPVAEDQKSKSKPKVNKAPANDFPSTVPPLDFLKGNAPRESAPKATNSFPLNPMDQKVDLVFVNTEVVQILRALASQADVNIVTSPEVVGKLTVSLTGVSVISALDFITTMSHLRYARLGNAFIVTSNQNFAQAVQQIKGGADTSNETRVVSLASGEGNQIKISVFKAIPQDTMLGHYDLVLPSEKVSLTQKSEAATTEAGAGGAAGGQGAKGAGGTQEQQTTAIQSALQDTGAGPVQANKDPYVVLVGSKARLDEIESMIRQLDAQIVTAARLGVTAHIGTRVIPIYSSQVSRIKDAVKALIDRDPNKDSFNITDTMTNQSLGVSSSLMMLLVSGPEEALDTIVLFAKSFDKAVCATNGTSYPETQADAARDFVVVDLKFVEPLEAAYELQKRINGLQASLMPASADPLMSGGTYERKKDTDLWNPRNAKGSRVFGEGGGQTSASGANSTQAGAAGSQSGGSNGGAQGGAAGQAGGGQSSLSGTAGVSMESRALGYEPMQLLLHGTPAQISQAKRLLAVMDVAPKTVAIEIRVMSLTKEEALSMGLDWSILTGGSVRTLRINQGNSNTASSPGTFGGTLGFAGGGSADILGTLDKLAGSNKMLARPNLLAVNGKPASMFVGDKIQYIKTIISSANGTTIEVGELNVGVEMIVVPRIGAEGNLMLDLAPSLTLLKGFTAVPGGGSLPQTTERYAQSQVIMKSGETIAIGGLIQDEDRKSKSGIPLLKDLPILGTFFSRTENDRTRTEIVFFVTAREVDEKTRGNASNPTKIQPGNGGN